MLPNQDFAAFFRGVTTGHVYSLKLTHIAPENTDAFISLLAKENAPHHINGLVARIVEATLNQPVHRAQTRSYRYDRQSQAAKAAV